MREEVDYRVALLCSNFVASFVLYVCCHFLWRRSTALASALFLSVGFSYILSVLCTVVSALTALHLVEPGHPSVGVWSPPKHSKLRSFSSHGAHFTSGSSITVRLLRELERLTSCCTCTSNPPSLQKVHGQTAEAQVLVGSDWVRDVSVGCLAFFISGSINRHGKKLHKW
jgi:hypothetical protein